jgi:hypothetical protein
MVPMTETFRTIESYPERQDAVGIVLRLIDGLGYRFYWATEGLSAGDYAYSPGAGCQTIGGLVGHVWGLVNWVHATVVGEGAPQRPADLDEQRLHVLAVLAAMRAHLAVLDEAALFALQIDGHPFWHVLNGPLSDALTHVGQIASFRRLHGNPVPRHNVFLGH